MQQLTWSKEVKLCSLDLSSPQKLSTKKKHQLDNVIYFNKCITLHHTMCDSFFY